MSSIDSIPTERRTRSGETPVVTCSASVSCEWVVDAGWMARLAYVPDIGQVAEQLEPFDEPPAGIGAAGDTERHDRPATVGHVLLLTSCHGLDARPGVRHPRNLVAGLEPLRHLSRHWHVTFHPQTQRLEALQEEERVQRSDGGPHVTQVLQAGLQDVPGREQRLGQLANTSP